MEAAAYSAVGSKYGELNQVRGVCLITTRLIVDVPHAADTTHGPDTTHGSDTTRAMNESPPG